MTASLVTLCSQAMFTSSSYLSMCSIHRGGFTLVLLCQFCGVLNNTEGSTVIKGTGMCMNMTHKFIELQIQYSHM